MHGTEQEWQVWLVQAQNFAKKENFADAVTRAKKTRDAIKASLASETDAAERTRKQAFLRRAETLLVRLEADFHAWNQAIADRRAERIAQAAAEQAEPLPIPADR